MSPVSRSCAICEGPQEVLPGHIYDDRYGYPGFFKRRECRECRHVCLEFDATPEAIKDIYTRYYPRSSIEVSQIRPHEDRTGWSSWLDGDKARAFRWVPPRVRVLDVGCGMGQALGYYERRGCDAYGVDPDSNAGRSADFFGYKIQVDVFDRTHFEPNFFDYISFDQVIEHSVDPLEMLISASYLLRSNGCVVLSTPNADSHGRRLFGRRWINWHAPYHLNLFTRRSIALAAERAGFRVVMLRTISPSDWMRLQIGHALLFPPMGASSQIWSQQKVIGRKERWVRRGMRVLDMFGIPAILTRLADATGSGDNLVAILEKKR